MVITKAYKLGKTESHPNIVYSVRLRDLIIRKGNKEMKNKEIDGKRGQKLPAHSNPVLVSPNSRNSIKKPTN